MSQDPASQIPDYVYAVNNPIGYVDPTGYNINKGTLAMDGGGGGEEGGIRIPIGGAIGSSESAVATSTEAALEGMTVPENLLNATNFEDYAEMNEAVLEASEAVKPEITPESNERLAQSLGKKYGGEVASNKGGHTVRIQNRKQEIVVRIMNKGGKNESTGGYYSNYWRMSVGNKAIDGQGGFSNGINPGDSHIDISPESYNLISKFIDRYLK